MSLEYAEALQESIYHLALGWSMGDWYQPNMSNEKAYLTRAEHRLHEHLVRNAGQIVSHMELLEAMSTENIGTLRRLISRLREKIEIHPALPSVIISHYGQGYSSRGKESARNRSARALRW